MLNKNESGCLWDPPCRWKNCCPRVEHYVTDNTEPGDGAEKKKLTQESQQSRVSRDAHEKNREMLYTIHWERLIERRMKESNILTSGYFSCSTEQYCEAVGSDANAPQ